jgi:hypothetical protein
MPNSITTKEAVRRRVWHALSPQTAEATGLSIAQLQQLVVGAYAPTSEQIERLANHLGLR